jgi:cell pole-organizing protein PopZ
MRELRVRVGEEAKTAATEIEQIRSRIQRNREADPPMRTISPAPRPPHNADFAGILSGDSIRPSQLSDFGRRDDPPPLRRTRFDAEPQYLPPPQEPRPTRAETIVSPDPAAAAGSSFNRLAETVLARGLGERSIEDVTRDMLRPMLRQWLDENLPELVERLVREEIERVARRGR